MRFLSDTFNRFARHSVLISAIKCTHLTGPARWLYAHSRTWPARVKRLQVCGIDADFYANSYEELRALETIFGENHKNEDKVLAFLFERLAPGDVVYDIGASIGIHSIFMAKRVGSAGRVVAFEPEEKSCRRFESNIRINGLNNVVMLRTALGDRVCQGQLHFNPRIGLGAVSLMDNRGSYHGQKVTIVPGDQLVREHHLPLPKAIKIDVEGYEYRVIRGLQGTLSNAFCEVICCEIHPNLLPSETNPEMVLQLIVKLGFDKVGTFQRGGEIHAICRKS